MKKLSDKHVVVVLQLDHEVYGTLEIVKFQRTEESIKNDVQRGSIRWNNKIIPIVKSIEVREDSLFHDELGEAIPAFYISVPVDLTIEQVKWVNPIRA